MSLWWLQPGWTDTRCDLCGKKIWPEGDPDHGVCYECFFTSRQPEYPSEPEYSEPAEQEVEQLEVGDGQ